MNNLQIYQMFGLMPEMIYPKIAIGSTCFDMSCDRPEDAKITVLGLYTNRHKQDTINPS